MILNFKKILEEETQLNEGMVGAVLGFKDCMYAILLQSASSSHSSCWQYMRCKSVTSPMQDLVYLFFISSQFPTAQCSGIAWINIIGLNFRAN